MTNRNTFDIVSPSNLSQKDLVEIYELEQDMWARDEGLGEYLSCDSCNRTYSKQDIYDKKDKEIYNLTVSEIERIFCNTPKCDICDVELIHIFSQEKYIKEIQQRYSFKAHLVLMKDENSSIVWFMDGYSSDFDTIYNIEFSDHYNRIGKEKIVQHIETILWEEIPGEVFNCCSMWTRENLMNLHNIYMLLQTFFMNFPNSFDHILWISELNSGGTLDKMYKGLWSQDIWMQQYQNNISCSNKYRSGIFIQKEIWKIYKQGFSKDLRTFLKERAI